MTRPPWIVWLGLAVVLAAAAILSFEALQALALAVGIGPRIAWLLPLSVDSGGAVSCAVWLGGRSSPDAARYAGRMTWCLLATTVLGNAAQLGMASARIVPPWWVATIVGSIAPAVVGSTVHLVVLLTRASAPARRGPPTPGDAPGDPGDRAGELIAEGAGRRRLSKELNITEHEARALLATHRNGSDQR